MSQPIFENFVREVLRDRGEPLQAHEFIQEFHKRGHPLGGANEQKQTWNKLWQAKVNGVLVHFPKPGYWLKDEPIPESKAVRNKQDIAEGKATRVKRYVSHKSTGRPPGRQRALTDTQVKSAERWIMEGKKIKEICARWGGLAESTFYLYFPEGIEAARERLLAEHGINNNEQDE